MNTFPRNPARSLQLMDISFDLAGITSESIFALSIRQAIQAGRVAQIVDEIYHQTQDNRPLVCDIVGYKTVQKIEKLYL